MMLHKSKGKWKWQNKATYCTEWSLSPIIKAYLEQLLTNKDKSGFGVPIYYCIKQAQIEGHAEYDWDTEIEGHAEYDWDTEIDLDAAHQLHINDIEELIWTFSDNEPDILSYDFEFLSTAEGEIDEKGLRSFSLECTNEEEYARYKNDIHQWDKRKQKGYELFGQIYSTALDW